MRINSPDAYKDKKRIGYPTAIIYAIIIGIVLAIIFIGGFKLLSAFLKVLISGIVSYWYYAIGIVIGLIIMKKLFGAKRVKITNADPYR